MERIKLTPEEAMEIEIRHLKEAAERFGGQLDRERARRRAAARKAQERVGAEVNYVSNHY